MNNLRFLLKNNKTEIFTFFLSLVIIIGALVYRFYALNFTGLILSFFLIVLIVFIIVIFCQKYKYFRINELIIKIPDKKSTKINLGWLGAYFVLFITSGVILWLGSTTEAINSPWLAIHPLFFLGYGATTLALIINVLKKNRLIPLLISLHYFLTFSVALIIYQIGYGFDPFIHQATVDLILEKGSVEPKPFYYLGQYALEVIAHKIFFLPAVWVDKLLVPVLAAALLPAALLKFSKKWFEDQSIGQLAIIGLLAIPCSLFIVTTPQNLAYLFLILTIIFGLLCAGLAELIFVYFLAIAALLIHPLAGIPAFLFALLVSVYHSDHKKIKPIFYSFIFLITSLSLPLVFNFLEKNASWLTFLKNISFDWTTLRNLFIFHNPGAENFILNFAHFYGQNFSLIIMALAALGIILALRGWQECKILFLSLLMSVALGGAYLISLNLDFAYLINYERGIFSLRILALALIFLLPFFIVALYWIWEKILLMERKIAIIIFIAAAIFITTALYVSYPRADRYANSHGYATSANDLTAVAWIEDNANGDYVVLSNQQVAAAALKTFGFSRYYQGDIYFYPVPTGGPLYQYYLKMVYEAPSRAQAAEAMDLAGVSELYFVLNKYWWAFPKILAEAKLSADSWTEHGDGEIYVFKYTK